MVILLKKKVHLIWLALFGPRVRWIIFRLLRMCSPPPQEDASAIVCVSAYTHRVQRMGVLLSPGAVFSGTFSVHRFHMPCCLLVGCMEQVIYHWRLLHGRGHPHLWVHPEPSQGLRPPLRAPLPTFSSEFPPQEFPPRMPFPFCEDIFEVCPPA